MFKKFVFLAAAIALLGLPSAGCGGPGEVSTIPAGERPEFGDGDRSKVPPIEGAEDVKLPDGVYPY